jgi:uncharacterized protein YndB with AHSA1/START domain
MAETGTLTLTRIFDAPVDLVWRCWTEKEHLVKWSAPKGFTIPRSQGDVRTGGKYHLVMRTPDGKEIGLGGEYREIVPHRLLVMTHIWDEDGIETVVTVRFENLGKRTRMTFEQTGFATEESRKGHAEGWNECFDLLAEHLATL